MTDCKGNGKRYIVGVDIGGTFTDAAAFDLRDEIYYYAKVPTSGRNPTSGVMDVIQTLSQNIGMSSEDLLSQTLKFAHGTTHAVNAMIQRLGAKTALLTTRGFKDHLIVMNANRGRGLPKFEQRDLARVVKPQPLVPWELTEEITERVDYAGRVVVPLDEREARSAVERLLREGIEALAVSFLWSFKNPSHEKRVKEIVRETAPDLFVTLSSELIPVIGEYERTFTSVTNSYLGPTLSVYVDELQKLLSAKGLSCPCLVMQSFGGLIPATEAPRQAVTLLISGLAGGVVGSHYLGELLDYKNIITADMGGTSFEVGMVYEGQPIMASYPYAPRLGPYISRWRLSVPTVDITAIGAGGGSIATVEEGILKVGPLSAQAVPGPACYGRGGLQPTVTDADLVLGYLNPDNFLGGRMKLKVELANEAIKTKIADPLGMSVPEAAQGIFEVINSHMADLMRKLTIEKGYDPREFILIAFGGAGPVHIGAFGPTMGVSKMLIPGRGFATAHSALGVAVADRRQSYARSEYMAAPFEPAKVKEIFREMEGKGTETLRSWGVQDDQIVLKRLADMRFKRQVHTLTVPWPSGTLGEAELNGVEASFESAYEALYGQGAAYREAGIEVTAFRLEAIGFSSKPKMKKFKKSLQSLSSDASKGHRPVFRPDSDRYIDTPVFDGDRLHAGYVIPGPSIIEYPGTTVVVYPGQRVVIDEYLNLIFEKEE
jgi:N-methylhydantoinase A